MTAIVLPDIDKSTIDELRRRIPDLTEIELPAMPSMKKVGKRADETIDRILGRSKAPIWPWVALGLAIVTVIGGIAAYLGWFRRSPWTVSSTEEPWTATTPDATSSDDGPTATWGASTWPEDRSTEASTEGPTDAGGLTAAESSLTSRTDLGEGA